MDIDIDTPRHVDILQIFPDWVRASVVKDGILGPHGCGVYAQPMPVDPLTGNAAIPYDKAEDFGFFKLDLLHLHVYDIFESREEIVALSQIEPNWDLLLIRSVVENLFQISKHYDILSQVKPRSIEDLADVLALIRPGKRNLLEFYLADKQNARRLLYLKDENGFAFKKSHAISYSMVIALQLHFVV